MSASTVPKSSTPYDFISEWSDNNLAVDTGGDVPPPETLKQVGRALCAIREFLIEPIAKELKALSDGASANGETDAVTYEDIGRLIAWTDELRLDCRWMLDTIGDITLIAHEDFPNLAEGSPADGVLDDPAWAARMRRFHGLPNRKDG